MLRSLLDDIIATVCWSINSRVSVVRPERNPSLGKLMTKTLLKLWSSNFEQLL